jgi:hypothetical protein
MKRFVVAICFVVCFGLMAAVLAQESEFHEIQTELMECSPPKFMLITDVDMEAKTLTGMSTIEHHEPKPTVIAFHMTLNLADIKVTNAKREAMDNTELSKMKGKLAVWFDGAKPLGAAYLSLFQEDAIIISIDPEKK